MFFSAAAQGFDKRIQIVFQGTDRYNEIKDAWAMAEEADRGIKQAGGINYGSESSSDSCRFLLSPRFDKLY